MRSRIAYGSEDLADLCALTRPDSPAGHAKVLARALAERPGRARMLLALRSLPVIEPRLSVAEHDRWLKARWPVDGEPLFAGHWAQAVIQTSPQEREYLTGRHRQAVRTNIRRASERGVTAQRLERYEDFVAAAEGVYASRPGGGAVLQSMRDPLPPGRYAWYSAATSGVGTPVVIAAIALYGDLGVLAVMVGDLSNPHAGHARYLLHNFIRGDLAAHRINHLLAGSVLRQPDGIRYFQRLLGYRICNVRPRLITASGGPLRDAPGMLRRLLMGAAASKPPQPPSSERTHMIPRREPAETLAAPPAPGRSDAAPPGRGPYVPAR